MNNSSSHLSHSLIADELAEITLRNTSSITFMEAINKTIHVKIENIETFQRFSSF